MSTATLPEPKTAETVTPPTREKAARFTLIDGLRGLAACAVMAHHFASHRAFAPLGATLPGPAEAALHYGGVGVAVFFVISGFVIAHSIGRARMSWGYFGNFALRRSIRLDPPYWATIALVILLGVAKGIAFPNQAVPLPSAGSLAAHATYTFGILGYEPILAVFWTLAHEVQFYVAYCLLLGFFSRFDAWPAWAFTLTGGLSATGLIDADGWATGTWWMFAAGVLLYYARVSRSARPWAVAFFLFALGCQVYRPTPYGLGCLAASALVAAAASRDWLAARPLQYLGAISYSLYLVHGVVGWQVLSVAGDVLKVRDPLGVAVCVAAAVAVSVIGADLMRRAVEGPSIRLANRLKRP